MLQYQTTQNFLKVYSEQKAYFSVSPIYPSQVDRGSAQCNSSETQADAGSLYIRTSTVTETREGKYGKPGTDSLKLLPRRVKCHFAHIQLVKAKHLVTTTSSLQEGVSNMGDQ